MDNTTLAYIAGIIDGEGCITIQKSHKKRCNSATYQSHVIVCMTSEAVIKYLTDNITGGWRTTQQTNNRMVHRFVVTGDNAYNITEAILPYLVEKKDQALKLLSLKQYCHGQGVKSTQEELTIKDTIFNELKEMHL